MLQNPFDISLNQRQSGAAAILPNPTDQPTANGATTGTVAPPGNAVVESNVMSNRDA